jgi:hypothetical protein
VTIRPIPLRELRSFEVNGRVRDLADPDGAPSAKQLLALWHAGALAIVHPDAEHHVFNRSQAAWAISWLRGSDE